MSAIKIIEAMPKTDSDLDHVFESILSDIESIPPQVLIKALRNMDKLFNRLIDSEQVRNHLNTIIE